MSTACFDKYVFYHRYLPQGQANVSLISTFILIMRILCLKQQLHCILGFVRSLDFCCVCQGRGMSDMVCPNMKFFLCIIFPIFLQIIFIIDSFPKTSEHFHYKMTSTSVLICPTISKIQRYLVNYHKIKKNNQIFTF